MIVLIAICLVLSFGYLKLMTLYRKGWIRQPAFILPSGSSPETRITVIIPARNEENNISDCISSILDQTYPTSLYEVIVVDDHSTDNTLHIINSFNDPRVRCLTLADYIDKTGKLVAFKKRAIATAIEHCTGDLIVTTDADCIAGNKWLAYVAGIYEKERPVMIVGPVKFTEDGSILQLFQSIDFMSMQGITGAANQLKMGNMSNGANLAFTRLAYEHVNGYSGIDHLASGDDYLLMMKMQHSYPGKIIYLKSGEAVISTAPQPDWGSFLQQRIRWASKSGKYDDKKLTAILLFVYLYNLSFLVLLACGFFNSFCWSVLIVMYIAKIIVELYFLRPVANFFNKSKELLFFPALNLLHIPYIIIAGLLGFVGIYKWKGRMVR